MHYIVHEMQYRDKHSGHLGDVYTGVGILARKCHYINTQHTSDGQPLDTIKMAEQKLKYKSWEYREASIAAF